MGATLAANRQVSANPSIIVASVVVTSNQALTDPSAFIFANIAQVRQQVGAPANYFISAISFVQFTQPTGLTYVYNFNISMIAQGATAAPLFGPQGPHGPPGPPGPFGPPGPTGPR